MWRQKFRIPWLTEEDHNTSFFHKVASSGKRGSIILLEMVGLSSSALASKLKSRVTEDFERHFKVNRRIHLEGWDCQFPCLEKWEANLLEAPFFEEEIYRELKEVDGNKAPGSDGFTFGFVQIFWLELKREFTSLVNNFFETAKFDK